MDSHDEQQLLLQRRRPPQTAHALFLAATTRGGHIFSRPPPPGIPLVLPSSASTGGENKIRTLLGPLKGGLFPIKSMKNRGTFGAGSTVGWGGGGGIIMRISVLLEG